MSARSPALSTTNAMRILLTVDRAVGWNYSLHYPMWTPVVPRNAAPRRSRHGARTTIVTVQCPVRSTVFPVKFSVVTSLLFSSERT